jgi:MoaA/NifB/PqqE/SkfB family radical SAM enzyme
MKLYLSNFIETVLGIRRWRYLDFCPTWRCNARCPTCGSYKRNGTDMSWDTAKQIARDPNFRFLERLVIEGGEPTLWGGLSPFVRYFAETHSKTTIAIISNGLAVVRLREVAERIEIYKKQIRWWISLNGIGGTHDRLRGVTGAYEKTIESVRFLKEKGFYVNLSFVPFADNQEDFELILKFAHENGVPVGVCYPCDLAKFGEGLKEQFIPQERLDEILNKTQAQKSFHFFMRTACEYFQEKAGKHEAMPCWAGKQMIHINPKGVIRPCSMDESMQIGRLTEHGVIHEDCDLSRIPDRCSCVVNGPNNCYITWTLRHNTPLLMGWKLKKMLGWK